MVNYVTRRASTALLAAALAPFESRYSSASTEITEEEAKRLGALHIPGAQSYRIGIGMVVVNSLENPSRVTFDRSARFGRYWLVGTSVFDDYRLWARLGVVS